MKYGKVLTYKDVEEAKKLIGKEVVCSDYLQDIEEYPEGRVTEVLNDISDTGNYRFRVTQRYFQFIREIIEEEPKRMTKRQLAEWGASRFGQIKGLGLVFTDYEYDIRAESCPLPDYIKIRPWGSDEWIEPTVDIYLRDCKKEMLR